MNPFLLAGKKVLVTGAAKGLGAAIAATLAEASAEVVLTDIDEAGLAATLEVLRGRKLAVSARRLDVTQEAEVDSVIAAMERVGGIDVLVNNAGTYVDVGGSIFDQTSAKWRRCIDQNLGSVFLCSKRAAEAMARQGRGGSIVNISSVDSAMPAMGVGYDVAKLAVNGFTRSLALDLSPHRIRVNCIAPGVIPVETFHKVMSGELPPLFPVNGAKSGLMNAVTSARMANVPFGMGEPTDVSHAVQFLASDAAKFITGQTLFVDGGWTLV